MKNKGFTLIEVIVVITIIGILTAVLVPSLTCYIDKSKKSSAIQTAINKYTELENALVYYRKIDSEEYLKENYLEEVKGFYYQTEGYVCLIEKGEIVESSKNYTPYYFRQNYDLSIEKTDIISNINYKSCVDANNKIYVYIPSIDMESGQEKEFSLKNTFKGSFLIDGTSFNLSLKKYYNETHIVQSNNSTLKKVYFENYNSFNVDSDIFTQESNLILYTNSSTSPVDTYFSQDKSILLLISTDKIWLDDFSNDMFMNFTKLEEIETTNLYSDFVQTASNMFYCCTSLEQINFENLSFPRLYSSSSMFKGCNNLKTVSFSSNVICNKINITVSMFSNCKNLETIDLSSFNFNNVTMSSYTFYNCNLLENIYIRKSNSFNKIDYDFEMFYNCENLPNFDNDVIDSTRANCSSNGYFSEIK